MTLYTLTAAPSAFDTVFDDFFYRPVCVPRKPVHRPVTPRYNVVESDGAHYIDIELPGVNEENVHIDVSPDSISVQASRDVRTTAPSVHGLDKSQQEPARADDAAATEGLEKSRDADNADGKSDGSKRAPKLHKYSLKLGLSRDVDSDGIAARLENGMLRITVPHRAASQPRRIALTH